MTSQNTPDTKELVERLKAAAGVRSVASHAELTNLCNQAADTLQSLEARTLEAERERDEALSAMERLASMEALESGRVIQVGRDDELIARIKFARASLGRETAECFAKWRERTKRDHLARRADAAHRTSDSPS